MTELLLPCNNGLNCISAGVTADGYVIDTAAAAGVA